VPIAERFSEVRRDQRGFDTDLLGIPERRWTTTPKPRCTKGRDRIVRPPYPTFPLTTAGAGRGSSAATGRLAFSRRSVSIVRARHGAVFYDLAQVWKNFSDVNFKFEGSDGLRQSVGFGIRVITPIGPLRADYGIPLTRNRIPFNITDPNGVILLQNAGSFKEGGQFFFSIGYPF
jgi:hypothetical protein